MRCVAPFALRRLHCAEYRKPWVLVSFKRMSARAVLLWAGAVLRWGVGMCLPDSLVAAPDSNAS